MATYSIGTLPTLPTKESTTAWYRPFGPLKPRDIAQEAFEHAVDCLRAETKESDVAYNWIAAPTTVDDIFAVVQTAQKRYESKSESQKRVMRWLARLSSCVAYYGKVFDVLAQHHPEYVSLAWGTMKFVFIGILNHESLVLQLSRALTKIGDVLPHTKLNAELYQTQYMKEAISQLYAHIILFFQKAVKWYNLGPAGRALSSIFKPFELDYQDTVEQIKMCSQTIEDIANGAVRAEIRDINILVQLQHNVLQERDRKLQDMQLAIKSIQRRVDDGLEEVLKVAMSHKTITESVQLDVRDIKPRIYEIHFRQILEFLKPTICPEESLSKSRSLIKRSQAFKTPPKCFSESLRHLSSWLSAPKSSIFLLKSGPRAETHAKDFALGVISMLEMSSMPVIWYLSLTTEDECSKPGLQMLLQSLIFQALKHSSIARSNSLDQLSIERLQDSHTEFEWLTLLCGILSSIPKCCIILEVANIYQKDHEACHRLLGMIKTLVERVGSTGSLLRVLLVNFGVIPSRHIDATQDDIFIASIRQAPHVTPRLRRSIAGLRRRSPWWKDVKVDASRF